MSTESLFTQQRLIVTAQAEFSTQAFAELKRLDGHIERIEELAPGVLLCSAPDVHNLMQKAAREQTHLLFTRHLAPVQQSIHLLNTEQDIGEIAVTLADLPAFSLLERGTHFAVQARFVQTDKSRGERPYSSGQLNKILAEALTEETGAVESIKKPQVVISLLCTGDMAYVGISNVEENLSSWPGGARHFAQTAEQISRAEFKLLEALETFGVDLPTGGRGLDLGAAPGGWTRLLLDADIRVVAVDPANLDPRITKRKNLDHFRGYAERYLELARNKHYKFDVIVNDMRMDAREAARLLVKAAPCLKTDGFIISTLKLPHATPVIQPLVTLKEALDIFKARYATVQARQLFHNRQEITLIAAHPLPERA